MKIGIVGLGYWGPNLVRNFLSTKGVKSVTCCDLDKNRLTEIKRRFPMIKVTSSSESAFRR